jgi:hypothetical protein
MEEGKGLSFHLAGGHVIPFIVTANNGITIVA